MLIDWITARLESDHLNPEVWAGLRFLQDRVQRFCPKTGEEGGDLPMGQRPL